MKFVSYFFALCCSLFCIGCVEQIDIEVEGHSELIVIDAFVADFDTVQTVYIRRERETLEYCSKGDYPPFQDNSVHIEDDNGWSDDFVDLGTGRKFELKGHKFEPGRTYTITVRVGDRVFKATEKMMPPPDIDGVKFYSSPTKDGGEDWSPILFFTDSQPDVDNYYLFANDFDGIRDDSQNRYVSIQILSDEGLRADIDGVKIDVGMGAEWYMSTLLYFGAYYHYEFMTISKDNYNYFKVLQDQIESDGGVYRPTPSSPVTNFSGKDVQGQFIAASGAVLRGRVWIDNIVDR